MNSWQEGSGGFKIEKAIMSHLAAFLFEYDWIMAVAYVYGCLAVCNQAIHVPGPVLGHASILFTKHTSIFLHKLWKMCFVIMTHWLEMDGDESPTCNSSCFRRDQYVITVLWKQNVKTCQTSQLTQPKLHIILPVWKLFNNKYTHT